jgi:OPA family glycerol-3-phosphate transporter-like MFS transporter
LNLLILRETPKEIGEPEPPANPESMLSQGEAKSDSVPVLELLRLFGRSPGFWIVCLLSLGLTLIRETFNTWTPTYFKDVIGLTDAAAAWQSASFPVWGGFSVLLVGYLNDRLGRTGRALVICFGLFFSGAALFAMASGRFIESGMAVALVSLVGFLLIGPYSYLAGAIALDFGGRRGSATAAGIIDGAGYLGGVLAGDTIARISVSFGWTGAFAFLGAVSWLCCIAGAAFWLDQRRPVTSVKSPNH